jgi:hypothetical protein
LSSADATPRVARYYCAEYNDANATKSGQNNVTYLADHAEYDPQAQGEAMRRILVLLLIISSMLVACAGEPAPIATPTLEPVQPLLPTEISQIPTATAQPTATAVPLGQASPVAQPIDPRCATRLPHLRYGLNVLDGPSDAALAKQINATWLRYNLRWSDLEPNQGDYRWDILEPILTARADQDLQLLLSIDSPPAWASPQGGLPADPTSFEQLITQLSQYTMGQVQAYEIWPAANRTVDGVASVPEHYAALLSAAYRSIKQADPCALVLMGALIPANAQSSEASDDLAFYRGILAANDGAAKSSYDILSVSLNTNGESGKGHWSRANQAESRKYFGHIELIRDEMTAADQADKQVWVVGLNYSLSGETPVSAEQQANYLGDTILTIREQMPWVSAVFASNHNDAQSDTRLLNDDGSMRPVVARLSEVYAEGAEINNEYVTITGSDLVMLWRYRNHQYPRGPLVLGPDGALYASDGGYITVLDPNGAFRLSIKPGRKYVVGMAADKAGNIYASADTDSISSFSKGGRYRWGVALNTPAQTPLLLSHDEQSLYSGSENSLLAYNTASGDLQWQADLGGRLGNMLRGDDGTLYVGTADNRFHAIAPDGEIRWSVDIGGWAAVAPAQYQDSIIAATNTGKILRLDPAGNIAWEYTIGQELLGVSANQAAIYATAVDDQLYSISENGELQWQSLINGDRPTAPIAAEDGLIYVAAIDGRINIFAPDGQMQGSESFRAPISIDPVQGLDGAIYLVVDAPQRAIVAIGTQNLNERYNAR